MNRVIVDQVIQSYKSFQFDRAHEKFLQEVEKVFPTLNQEAQIELGSLLEIYEEAFKNDDVLRLCDIITYYIFPLAQGSK